LTHTQVTDLYQCYSREPPSPRRTAQKRTPKLLAHMQNCATNKVVRTPAQLASTHTLHAQCEFNVL